MMISRNSSTECSSSGKIRANGSANTVIASSNETSCLTRFASALFGSHSNRRDIFSHVNTDCGTHRQVVGYTAIIRGPRSAQSIEPSEMKSQPSDINDFRRFFFSLTSTDRDSNHRPHSPEAQARQNLSFCLSKIAATKKIKGCCSSFPFVASASLRCCCVFSPIGHNLGG